jgi:ABC-2 type transport system ATP-binding protein
VLLSTHLLTEVEEHCSRVLILNRGQLVAQGPVAEIVRRASAPRTGLVHVAPDQTERALAVLAGTRGVHAVERSNGRPGALSVVFATAANGADVRLNDAVGALVASDVSLLSFELEGARLSDAFLAMTGAAES